MSLMDILLVIPDFFIKKIILNFIKLIFFLCLKYLGWRKSVIDDQGRIFMNEKVTHQQEAVDFLSSNVSVSKINDLPRVLHQLLTGFVQNKYRIIENDGAGSKQTVFRVNGCRISTFFVFTDGQRVVMQDREKSASDVHRLNNPKFDMIGSVNFENSSIFKKISADAGFFDVKPLEIELIPGFAFEDTTEIIWDGLFYPKTAVVMVGLCIKLSPQDLEKARSINGKTQIDITSIHALPSDDVMTSKAKLAAGYLKKKYP